MNPTSTLSQELRRERLETPHRQQAGHRQIAARVEGVVAAVSVHDHPGAACRGGAEELVIDVGGHAAAAVGAGSAQGREDVATYPRRVAHVEVRHRTATQLHPVARGRRRWRRSLRQRRGDGDQLSIAEGRRGEGGDRGAVEASAQQQAAGPDGASNAAGDRLFQHRAVGLQIIGFVAIDVGRCGLWGPVTATRECAVRLDRDQHPAAQALDAVEWRLADGLASPALDQERFETRFGHGLGHVRRGPDAFDLGREGDEVRAAVEEHVPLAHVVASEQQPPGPAVPDGEREVAEQVIDTGLAPAPVGRHQQAAVGHARQGRSVDRQFGGKRLAIVEPNVGDKDRAVSVRQRLGVEGVLRRHLERQKA
jgi:hypothetical protein